MKLHLPDEDQLVKIILFFGLIILILIAIGMGHDVMKTLGMLK